MVGATVSLIAISYFLLMMRAPIPRADAEAPFPFDMRHYIKSSIKSSLLLIGRRLIMFLSRKLLQPTWHGQQNRLIADEGWRGPAMILRLK